MAPTFLFVLCAAAFVVVGLVSVLSSGGGGASRAQKERLASRHAAVVEAKEKEKQATAGTVVAMPTAGEKPEQDEAAA